MSYIQDSQLAIKMGDLVISSIGAADDTVLLSNSIYDLYYLLQLTLFYCSNNNVTLCPDKTQLQVYFKGDTPDEVLAFDALNPIHINGQPISLSKTAEHLGVIRNTDGNYPSLASRFAAHRRSLASVLHVGMARNHRSNPVMALRLNHLYGTPVLLSGLASLILTDAEIDLIEKRHRQTLNSILRLYPKTPRAVIYFLAGTLPGSALLHLRQLSLFGMISRLSDNILRQHAFNLFQSKTIAKSSWFDQIRRWCLMYELPHPLDFLLHPPSKQDFRTLVKKKVVCYWENHLREEASALTSLVTFKPGFMSLTRPHPLWNSAGSSPVQVTMATVQARMLSGRYRTGALMRHWKASSAEKNKGFCQLSDECSNVLETLPHVLCSCPALESTRRNLASFTLKCASKMDETLAALLLDLCDPASSYFFDFLLDCSTIPAVINLVQQHNLEVLDKFFAVTRTWVYVIHRERLKMLGRWHGQTS